ncbi:MAG: polyphenol oxidase family protein [Bdellovibrionota bacterium]
MIYRSELLASIPGIDHGFGTASEPVPLAFAPSWDASRPHWHQVHGVSAARILGPAQQCGQVDALWARESGMIVPVRTADCVPVLLARRDGSVVAAAHAGWRGTYARILGELWSQLSGEGEAAKDWVAAIGPSIRSCCFEVSEEIARDFSTRFGAAAVPRARHVDLQRVNLMQLQGLGFAEVEVIEACTRCTQHGGEFVLHSYRREGKGTRQYSVIARV